MGYFRDGTPITRQSLQQWKRLSPIDKIERNSNYLRRQVLRWDQLCQMPLVLPSVPWERQEHYVIFLHIPKTGGTTLEHIIAKNYGPTNVVHVNSAALTQNPAVVFDPIAQDPRAIIMGHHKRSSVLYECLRDRPLVHITLLRDPIKRVISHFRYIKTTPSHALYEQVQAWTWDDYAHSSIAELQNFQTLRLLGYRPKNIATESLTSQSLTSQSLKRASTLIAEAKTVLQEEFTLFGLTDRYAEFLLMGQTLLNWTNIVYQRQNKTDESVESAWVKPSLPSTALWGGLDDEVIAVMRDRNQMDIQLYDFAQQLFEHRCQALQINPARVSQYNAINATYQGILAQVAAL